MSTKKEILSLLRRETLTINELSKRLGVTRNAVIVPLRQLEADRLVRGAERRDKRVGKPAVEYATVAGFEDVASRAYPAFAQYLLETLPDHLARDRILELMRKIGERMAEDLMAGRELCFQDSVEVATGFADDVGAETVVTTHEEATIVRSYSCPLGRAVRQEPAVCSLLASFFAKATGARVDEQCQRGERLICKFALERRESAAVDD